MDFLAQWRDKPVLVTGGTGLIGQYVIEIGLRAGVEIHNFSTRSHPVSDAVHHTVDLRNREQVLETVRMISPVGVLHLAAGGVTDSAGMASLLQTNVIGIQTLLEALTGAAPVPVVIAGSWFEYAPQDRPLRETDATLAWSPYTATKLAAHIIASYYARQLPITILRIFSVYGPGERLPRLAPYVIESALAQRPVELTAGEQVRDYVYAGDVARAFWYALHHRAPDQAFRVLNVGTGQPITLRFFVEKLLAILREHGLHPEIIFGAKPYRDHETMYAVADTTAIRAALGWQPVTSLEDGFRAMLANYGR